MHLLANGHVTFEEHKDAGILLLTDTTAFVLGSAATATKKGMAFGIVGVLFGGAADRRRAKAAPPAHLEDPEIAALPEKVRRPLLTTRLLAKIPLDGKLRVSETKLGFDFGVNESQDVRFKGWAHKKKIRAFLEARGVEIG